MLQERIAKTQITLELRYILSTYLENYCRRERASSQFSASSSGRCSGACNPHLEFESSTSPVLPLNTIILYIEASTMSGDHLSNEVFFTRLADLVEKTQQTGHGSVHLSQRRSKFELYITLYIA
jgi:hypothetical protein